MKENNGIPLSFAQQRLWFLEQLEPNTPVYNVPFALHLRGALEEKALARALNAVIARHEALRTNFVTAQGRAVQVIRKPEDLRLQRFELAGLDLPEREHELQRLLAREARRPFNLSTEALIRAVLARLGPEEHVLLLTLHHIICDEWSLRVLFRELARHYACFHAGEAVSVPDLPVQYADYALWQRDWLQGPVLQQQLDYWRQRLTPEPPVLDLPADRALAGDRSWQGARHTEAFPPELSNALREFSRHEGVTLFVTLLAAFQALLWRYTRQDEITVGSPMAGRARLETEELIGFFVNTLVLRSDFSGDPTFREAVRRVLETTLDAYDHQDLPFEKLVEELHPQRSDGRIPFVRALFALQETMDGGLVLPGLEVSLLDVETGTAKVDLTWVVREGRQGLEASVEYATALFEPGTIARLVRQWKTLLQGVLAHPDRPLSAVPILTEAEGHRAVVDWNQTSRPYPSRSLAELFEGQVEARPGAIAVRYAGVELSYAALNRRANSVAHDLRQLGVGPEVIVALCMERSVDLVVALLGIIKAGGAYLPLDPGYPRERLSLMLEDTAAPVLLTQEALRKHMPAGRAQVVTLDTLSEGAVTNPAPSANPESLAYVIYTSGSTGQPKGVLVPQRGIIRLVCNTDYAPLSSADRVAQLSNVAFDAATFEIWGALLNGATLVGFGRDIAFTPKDLAAHLQAERITTLFLTTALFNQMAAEVPAAFSALRYVLFGGEAVDPKAVRKVLEVGPPEALLHVYGPTETTTFASYCRVTEVPENATTVPIGRPIANTRVYVLDPRLEPVPVGLPGEIYIGGPGVARGYLRQENLTAEKFIPDPFTPEAAARLYRTGDLARYRADGSIEFLGRRDQQVKIRGFRVEPGEIEAVLAAHPAVRESMVVARDADSRLGKTLVGYVVLNAEAGSALKEVRAFLKEKLPAYMVPAHLVPLAKLPLNANGKVDRRALPAPDQERPELREEFRCPRTAVEEQLVAIWKEVLGLRSVGVRDNFFDLGGHSLLAVRLFASIEEKLGKKLPLACLFQHPTIQQLARWIDNEPLTPAWPCIVDIQPDGTRPPFFWVHSLGGDGGGGFFYYRKLAQLLGPDQPSFGIRSPQEPFTRIEAMATHYVREIRRVQPEGPYYLGGFCFGGVVAFEMARVLRAAGKEVGLLALLESVPPWRPGSRRRWSARSATVLVGNVHYWVRDLLDQKPGELARRLRRKANSARKHVERLFRGGEAEARDPGLADFIDMSQYPKDYIRYAEAHWQALLAYYPQPYPGQITLFRARKQPLLTLDPTLGWGGLASGGVAVNIIPGTHEKMLEEPNLQILVAALKTCLVEAQTQGHAGSETAPRMERDSSLSSACSI